MSKLKKFFIVLGRLPLLFLLDNTLKGTLINANSLEIISKYLWDSTSSDHHTLDNEGSVAYLANFFAICIWSLLLIFVSIASVVLVCSPIETLLEVYGCFLCSGLLFFSYQCNNLFVHGIPTTEPTVLFDNSTNAESSNIPLENLTMSTSSIVINIFAQLCIAITFDQICIAGTLYRNKFSIRYFTDTVLFISFSFPIFLHSFLDSNCFFWQLSPALSLFLPIVLLGIHSFFVFLTIISAVIPALRNVKVHIREIGIDGLLVRLMEKAHLSWLLRIFFFTKVFYFIMESKTLKESEAFDAMSWSDVLQTWVLIIMEVLHIMCETILSVMSLASIVSVISGWCLRLIYYTIGAYDEEESLQPAVSGFLFVLLAMQTGITSMTNDARLQLLFQNCILLLVANQHFVQTVAADLLLKASTDDVGVKKHIRPMLPYLLFFSFPVLVVMPLWQYSFRVSWLLAISAFSLELLIKSFMTLTIYVLNMLHSHTRYFQENLEDLLFYIKAVCGCCEFACGIFLFLNGAYIFIFESGGIIRFVMMIIHLYFNIYQTALKGLATYKLRQSAWNKVNNLPAASQEQLDDNDDICPICYQEMREAVVIKCSHVFHKGCLRKWLSIQETCPLCHTDLKSKDFTAEMAK